MPTNNFEICAYLKAGSHVREDVGEDFVSMYNVFGRNIEMTLINSCN